MSSTSDAVSTIALAQQLCHIVHMKTLTIRELHIQTGRWVRKAQESSVPIVITDRGRPVATLAAYDASARTRPLPNRTTLKERLPKVDVDSSLIVSDMRNRS